MCDIGIAYTKPKPICQHSDQAGSGLASCGDLGMSALLSSGNVA